MDKYSTNYFKTRLPIKNVTLSQLFKYHHQPGVHIIPKIAGFLDPKIIFLPPTEKNCPNCKKCPQLEHIFKFH